jgi:2-polyprenyl-3-methyl-5-hydroxy-6-metoxy-1,4-benzoquinol methylase
MVDLREYYNQRVNNLNKKQFLKQVGHSINGIEISVKELDLIINDILEILAISKDDTLLDICCGNGVITQRLSRHCKSIVAIDLSNKMIDVAKQFNGNSNIRYINCDFLHIEENLNTKTKFSKIIMFAALQHFSHEEFSTIIKKIQFYVGSEFTIMFGFIPNQEYKKAFFSTIRRKVQYLFRKYTNSDVMGTWWNKQELEKSCNKLNLNCEFIEIPINQYGSPYRFHVVIKSY